MGILGSSRDKGFEGKSAFITGGASGIGRALAQELKRRGACVSLADVDRDGLAQVGDSLGAHTDVLDVRDADAVANAIRAVKEREGRLDYVFNNAGIAIAGEALHNSLQDWNKILDINVRGVVNGVVAAYPIMIEQGFGHIVNTASVAGLTPTPGLVSYAASKHAVVGLSTSLRFEAARYGVRVSAVCPGLVQTGIQQNMEVREVTREDALASMPVKPVPVEPVARDILRGVSRNRAVIIVTGNGKLNVWLHRRLPRLHSKLQDWQLAKGTRAKDSAGS